MTVEVASPTRAHHGEGPVWWGGRLHWVDMMAGDILSIAQVGEVASRVHVGGVVAALRPRETGGLVVGNRSGFALLDVDGQVEWEQSLWTQTDLRMNDGACDPEGNFYCGSMSEALAPGAGSLIRLTAELRTQTVLEQVTISNGLQWDPGRGRAYYVDTATGRVDWFPYRRGATDFADRRTLVAIDSALGSPDGLCLDQDGRVWVALWGGSAVRCYGADGRLCEHLEVPARFPSACQFGGPGLDTLFITSSRYVDGPVSELDGCLFAAAVGTRGLVTLPFSG